MEEQLYYDIYQYLNEFIIPSEYNIRERNRVVQTAKHYYIENDKLYCKNKDQTKQCLIKPNEVPIILYNLHNERILELNQHTRKLKNVFIGLKCMKMYEHILNHVTVVKEEEGHKEE